MVTLVGPGGIGKTRLATRYGDGKVDSYSRHGGVWIVDLSEAWGLDDALDRVERVLAKAINHRTVVGSEQASRVARRVARLGRALLILDNVEHLAAEFAPVVEAWVRRASSVRFLVTSRVALECDAEHILDVGPLAADDAQALFRRRVQLVSAEGGEDEAVVGIVDAIDRIPLAIELAASRTRVLSLADLRARLVRPLDLLRGSKSASRHASMRQAVLDSVSLLIAPHQRLFALASCLRNGFTLGDAEAVLGDIALPREDILDGVEDLVRTSLLRVSSVPAGAARYEFFRTIREVAEEIAVEEERRQEAECAQRRHFASRWPSASGFEEAELDNQLLAHECAIAEGSAEAASIALGLEPWLRTWGRARLRVHLFDETLRMPDVASTPKEEHVRMLLGRGLARRELGDTEEARSDFEVALGLLENAPSAGLKAESLTGLADIYDIVGDTERARELCREALELLSLTADDDERRAREASASLLLGHAFRREGKLALAHEAIVAAIERFRLLREGEGLATALYERCVIEMFDARAPQALATVDEGIAVAQRVGARIAEGTLIVARGALLQEAGRFAEALEALAEGARIFDELDSRYREASTLYYLASVYAELGELAEAMTVLGQAEQRIATVRSPHYETLIASCRASVLAMMHLKTGRPIEDAQTALRAARLALKAVPNEPALSAAVEVHELIVEVAIGGDAQGAIARGVRLVDANANDDSRYSLRLLRSLEREQHGVGGDALVVWPGGNAFALPGSTQRVNLPAESPLRRILHHLTEKRIVSPGEVASIDDLISAGWPGETILGDAALNRAYVALSTLRKKGLRDVLLRVGGGYALSQSVVVRRGED